MAEIGRRSVSFDSEADSKDTRDEVGLPARSRDRETLAAHGSRGFYLSASFIGSSCLEDTSLRRSDRCTQIQLYLELLRKRRTGAPVVEADSWTFDAGEGCIPP